MSPEPDKTSPPADVVADRLRELAARLEGLVAKLDGRPKWLDVDGAAAYFGVSRSTIYAWIDHGLPCHRLPSASAKGEGILRFRPKDLDAWGARFRARPGRGAKKKVASLQ